MHLLGQPMFKMKEKIGNRKVIHLEIGDPDFDTPWNIREAAVQAIDRGESHYCSSYGIPELIEAVQFATQRSRGFTPAADQILITPGANIGVFYAVYCCCEPGDAVLIPNPGFPTYTSAVIAAGCRPVYYPLGYDFKINFDLVDDALATSGAKFIILNSPSNPTGAVTSIDHLRVVYSSLEHYNAIGYSDEIYARMVYDSSFASISAFDHCRERIILSNGFSKAYAMTGWRLGAMIAPAEITHQMMLLLQTTQSCVQPFIQRAGVEAILSDQTQIAVMMATYCRRRDVLVQGLRNLGFQCKLPGGAFYVFPRYDILFPNLSSEEMADLILNECEVAVLPGTDFGDRGAGHLRLSYATSMENIETAVVHLRRLL